MRNREPRLPPMENDQWFDNHVVPKIDKIEKRDDGIFIIAISLCWDRHPFNDAYAGRVNLAAYPHSVFVPQKWMPNFAHGVRFWKTLKAKLDTFKDKPNEMHRVDIRLYTSGASGPKTALINAFDDRYPRQGLPYFETPITWSLIPMTWNSSTRNYEEEPLITSLPTLDGYGE